MPFRNCCPVDYPRDFLVKVSGIRYTRVDTPVSRSGEITDNNICLYNLIALFNPVGVVVLFRFLTQNIILS